MISTPAKSRREVVATIGSAEVILPSASTEKTAGNSQWPLSGHTLTSRFWQLSGISNPMRIGMPGSTPISTTFTSTSSAAT
jgi:hypothetical protein